MMPYHSLLLTYEMRMSDRSMHCSQLALLHTSNWYITIKYAITLVLQPILIHSLVLVLGDISAHYGDSWWYLPECSKHFSSRLFVFMPPI